MKEKNLTPQESMSIITAMIDNSKHRVAMTDLKISVMWALLTVATAAAVLVLGLVVNKAWINFIWFAIPVIGFPVNMFMSRKSCSERNVTTFVDRISSGIWKAVGFIAVVLTLMCTGFSLCGFSRIWLVMFYYAFIVVGFGSTAQGLLVRENAYVFGGLFSVISGFILVGLTLCGIPLLAVWAYPLYIVCFLLMFVVPAAIVAGKLKKETDERA